MANEKQMIEVSSAKEFVMANYPNDPLLKHIAVALLDQLPKVEAVEVVHGRWKGAGFGDYYCSICSEEVSGNNYSHCPNCGAKMDVEVTMECKFCDDFTGICTNGECPMRGDCCPVPDVEGLCKYESRLIPCGMCDNAFVNPELSEDEDLSYVTLGSSEKHMRIMMQSGNRKPTQIIFERYYENSGWHLVGYYAPRFCPNCGRELIENKKEKVKNESNRCCKGC